MRLSRCVQLYLSSGNRSIPSRALSFIVRGTWCDEHVTGRRCPGHGGDTFCFRARVRDAVSRFEFTQRATNRTTTPDAATGRVNANSTRALFPARRRAPFPPASAIGLFRLLSLPLPFFLSSSFTNPPTPIRKRMEIVRTTMWSNRLDRAHVHVRWTIRNSLDNVSPQGLVDRWVITSFRNEKAKWLLLER